MAPILRTKTYTRGGITYRMDVEGGLRSFTGQRPYFSLTADVKRKAGNGRWVEDSGGAMHEEILRLFPTLADLAALHLSDDRGAPMHAESNGWYWMAGALGGSGERHHGGNSGYAKSKPEEECLQIFAKHARVTMPVAAALRDSLAAGAPDTRRAVFREWIGAQGERWALEAAACIERHGLAIFA